MAAGDHGPENKPERQREEITGVSGDGRERQKREKEKERKKRELEGEKTTADTCINTHSSRQRRYKNKLLNKI